MVSYKKNSRFLYFSIKPRHNLDKIVYLCIVFSKEAQNFMRLLHIRITTSKYLMSHIPKRAFALMRGRFCGECRFVVNLDMRGYCPRILVKRNNKTYRV